MVFAHVKGIAGRRDDGVDRPQRHSLLQRDMGEHPPGREDRRVQANGSLRIATLLDKRADGRGG